VVAQPLEGDPRRTVDLDTHLGGAPDFPQRSSRPDQRLGRDARHVDARTADLVALHHDDAPPRLGAIHRQRLARLATADDQ